MSTVTLLKPGAAHAAVASAQSVAGTVQTAVRCILMVEDDAHDADLLRAFLAQACGDGVELLHARTLAEGLALQQSRHVQLTLLDLDLPDSSGLHTLERMRAAAAGPIVVVSGNGDPMLVEEALKRSAYDVIPKHELNAATLQRVLRRATVDQEAARALRVTEGRFRALLENSAETLVLFGAGGRIEYVSAAMHRALGYDAAEVIGHQGLSFVHAGDRAAVRDAFRDLLAAAGATRVLRVRFVHKDGSQRVQECALVNRLADPDVAGIVGSFRDLTREEEQRARFDATFEHAAVGLAHVDLEGRILLANLRLCDMFGTARAALIGRAVRELSHPEDIDATVAQRALLHEGKIPQFTLRKRYLRPDASVLWVQLTLALERDVHGAPLYEIAAFEDVSGAVHREEALRASEERFRNLTELSSDWYWEQDAEFRFTKVSSDPGSEVFSDPAYSLGKARWELPLTPLSCSWEAHRETLGAHRAFRDFEYSYAGSHGKLRYISASGYPLLDAAGRFQGYRGMAKDITQRKRAEGALQRFRAALDISADSIFLVDVDSMQIIDMNDAAARNLGYERDELLGAEIATLFVDRSREDLRAQYEQLLEQDNGEALVRMHHRRKDGSIVPVEVTRRVLRTPEGRYIIGIARDLTERQRSEERLRSSHERFEIVSRATSDVVWDWNLVTNEIWWNENFQKLFGYEPQEVGAYADSWTSRIHPEDAPGVKSQVDAAIATGAKAWAGEYRFRRKDGSYADVYDRGLLMHDTAGRAVRMIGALMDISERKHAEGRVRVHAERQAAIARFGQFALGRPSPEELYTEAARALRCEGVDAVCLLEMFAGRREYLVRATQGEGPHASLGQTGAMAPDSVWPEMLRENAPRIAGKAYLAARPLDRPWRAWLRTMGSAVYAPVRDDEKPVYMLCIYAVQEHAFGAEDVRFVEAVGNVLSSALQRHKAEARLAHLAQFDALTGLPNRTLLQDRVGQAIVQSRRRHCHAGVLFVDLDRFKLINDTLGHHQGDALICQVGQRLLACVRAGDTVGRISGDEFAVVLADMARPDDAALVGQKILDALAAPFDLGGNEAYITASVGIAVFPGDGEDAETLLKNADMAMYRAKESARNSYCFFTAEMNQRSVAKAQLNMDLRHALERSEFVLHYQPKVDLASGALCGLEALLRWNHPARGLVSPAEFIPALEDSGLIIPVGEWVIEEACRQMHRWTSAGRMPLPVAVNLSPKQFRRRDLDALIRSALVAAGIAAGFLELEITESCLMENPEDAVRVMRNLRAAGLRISIDDFGTGYSSLSYLTRLPLSALKIDRSFVRDADSSPEAASIVRAVIDMAQNLHLTVVAEGVETEQQAAFLRRHGCDQAQGYLFSRPVPAEAIAALLAAAP